MSAVAPAPREFSVRTTTDRVRAGSEELRRPEEEGAAVQEVGLTTPGLVETRWRVGGAAGRIVVGRVDFTGLVGVKVRGFFWAGVFASLVGDGARVDLTDGVTAAGVWARGTVVM